MQNLKKKHNYSQRSFIFLNQVITKKELEELLLWMFRNYGIRKTCMLAELLKEAGYENGFTFTITVPSNYQFHVDTAQVIVEQLKQVGVTAQIQLIEWASWISDVYTARNYESTIIGLDANMTPSNVMFRYVSTDPKNFINYANTEYDAVYAKAIAITNDEEKIAHYKQLQEILAKDAASVFIQAPANIVAVNQKLKGYQFYPVYVQDLSTVYYEQ